MTVTGESPVVDVQTTQVAQVVSSELLNSIPTGRNFQQFANITPAVSTGNFDVGGSTSAWTGGALTVHGSVSGDSRTMIDGMATDGMFGNGQCACVYDNENQTQEVVVQVAGGAAEHQLSGVLVNRIPKSGGNTFQADSQLLFSNGNLQGDNVDDALRARNMLTPAQLAEQYDLNFSVSGPILRDRLWFFTSGRHWTYNNYVADVFNEDGSQTVNDNALWAYPTRLTWQMTRRDRLTGLITFTEKVAGHQGLTSAQSGEAVTRQDQPGEKIAQLKWTSTLSSRLLLEAGGSRTMHQVRYQLPAGSRACDLWGRVPPVSRGDVVRRHFACRYPAQQDDGGRTLGHGRGGWSEYEALTLTGDQYLAVVCHGDARAQGRVPEPVRVAGGQSAGEQRRPESALSQRRPLCGRGLEYPGPEPGGGGPGLGVYVQDTWTRRRLTLSGGVRWDHFNSYLPAQTAPAGRFVPTRSFPEVKDLPNWNNVVPRVGVSYDLTGEGKTAVKANFGVFVQSMGTGYASTYDGAVMAVDQRTWSDLNRDDIAQENEIGPSTNVNFGVRRNRNADPENTRPYQLLGDVAVQHELFGGLGLSVGYYHRRVLNNLWTQNLVVDPVADYTLVQVPDPRGSGTLPVYNLSPAKFGLVDEYDTNSDNNVTWYRGMDVTVNGRWRVFTFLGGTSTGRTLASTCDVADPNNWRFCDQSESDVPLQTQFKLAGSASLPYGVRLGANFQSRPGTERSITYQVVRAILPTLTQTSVTVRLNEPGSDYNDPANQLDVTLSKVITLDRLRVRPEVAIFNALNANPVVNQTNVYGPSLGNVITILSPRMVRLGVNLDF